METTAASNSRPRLAGLKVLVIDDVVYMGSANLDPRSVSINFEVMLRIRSEALAQRALAKFQ